ncbi:hypothetical protein DBR00_02595 [Pseudomonas sp. HMWF032]|uniref:hypothetical protein n=1 Tax=Pseudomonas sp. HMWF032 TaxID=2056866 RepID=UPI000D3CD55E|nr:hypothetical protein [Pseudomonas sp. HMWF032]PTS86463.1 hypothetical protein DBR00_02595 [Pseudomonas sp. HMWF032]PTT81348.1 hypothetical protein DBR41_16935 [Pseudomonas sp. HMWF010]
MTISLRYAPGHKAFTVQDEARTILAKIPHNKRASSVNVQGTYYAISPADYVKAMTYRPVELTIQMATAEVVKEQTKAVVRKSKSKVGGFFRGLANYLVGSMGVRA